MTTSENKEVTVTFDIDGYSPLIYRFPLEDSNDVTPITLDDIKDAIEGDLFSLSWVTDHLSDGSLTTDLLASVIQDGTVPLTGEGENIQKYIDLVKSLIVDNTFSISTIESFVKSQIFGEASEEVELLYNSIKSLIETGKVDVDAVKALIVDQILNIDCIKDLVNAGAIKEETLQNLVKDGHFNQEALIELVTGGLVSLEFIQDLDAKGYIDAKGLEEALKNIDFTDFDTLTDPETIEQIAKGILPEKYKDWAIVAADLVKEPEKAAYEAGEKAVDMAGAEINTFIQGPGKEKLKVVLDSVPGIGAFFQATGLDEMASTGITTLAVEGVNKLTSLIKGKFGFGVKSVPPAPYVTKIRFTGAPKVIYALNESFSYDGIVVEATMSDGTKKELDFSSLNMTGFDSRQYTDEQPGNEEAIMKFTLASGGSENTEDLEIDYPYIVAEKFLNGVKYGGASTNRTQYIVGEDFDTTGLILKATYTDNTESDVPESAVTISGFDNTKVGTQTIKAWYGGEYYVELSVEVIAPKPDKIYLIRPPDQTIFFVNEDFNANGIVVTGDYTIDGKTVNLLIPSGLLTITTEELSKTQEKQPVTISYQGYTLDYTINVIDHSFELIQVQTKPKKRQFRPGEKFTSDGLLIVGIEGDKTHMVVDPENYTMELIKYAEEVKGNDIVDDTLYKRIRTLDSGNSLCYFKEPIVEDLSDYYFTTEDVGAQLSVSITSKKNLYDDSDPDAEIEYISTFYTVEVLPERKDFLRYSVTKEPNKLVYNKYEKLDLTGIEISALYGQNLDPSGEKDPSYDQVIESIVIFSGSFEFNPETFESVVFKDGELERTVVIYCTMKNSLHKTEEVLEKILLDVSYKYESQAPSVNEDHVCTFPVKIIDGNIEAIQVSQYPKTEYLFNESLDITGMEVVAIYTNGYRWVIPNDQLVVEGFDSSLPRHRKLKVSYECLRHPSTKNGLTEPVVNILSDSFTINVDKGNLNAISIKSLPSKTKYYPKEDFDPTGLSLLALYSSGYTETVSLNDSRLKIVGFYNLRVKKVVPITVDFSGYRATFCISIVQRNIHHISLEAPPKTVVYVAGTQTPASWVGMRILAHNTNGETSPLDIKDVSIVGFDSDCPYGLIECSIDYEGLNSNYSTSMNLLVLEGQVTKLTMKSKPIKAKYGLFDTIDLAGMVVEIECENSAIPREIPYSLLTVQGFDTNTVTSEDPKDLDYTRTCVLSLGGTTVDNISFSYTVSNSNFKGLRLHPSTQKYLAEIYQSDEDPESKVISYPLNLLPYDNILVEEYETNDGVYEIKKYIGEVIQDTENYTCSCALAKDENSNAYGYTLKVTKANIGKTEASLSYTFGIICQSKDVDSPTIPTKKTYLLGEQLNLEGGYLRLLCKDSSFVSGTESVLEPYQQWVDVYFSDDQKDSATYYKNMGVSIITPDMSYSGEKTVKITTCMGHCWAYQVLVVSPDDVPIDLDIESEPTKVDYNVGDQEIDLSGIEIYQIYSDGSKIKLSETGLKVETFDTSTAGLSKVVISYIDQLYASYNILVHEVPSSIEIIQKPDCLEYYPDEEIDLTGLVVEATYMDEKGRTYTEMVDNSDIIVNNFDTNLQNRMLANPDKQYLLGGTENSLFSIEYRGAVTFIPYTLIIDEPGVVAVKLLKEELKDNLKVIQQKQTKIDLKNGVLYLKDVEVSLEYKNGSLVLTNLEDLLKSMSASGNLVLTSTQSVSTLYDSLSSKIKSGKAGDFSTTLSLYGWEFLYEVSVVENTYYEMNYSHLLIDGVKPEDLKNYTINPNNKYQSPVDIVFSLKKSNGTGTITEEIAYSTSSEYLENVPELDTIETHLLGSEILYIKDGYCIAFK